MLAGIRTAMEYMTSEQIAGIATSNVWNKHLKMLESAYVEPQAGADVLDEWRQKQQRLESEALALLWANAVQVSGRPVEKCA